MILVDIDYLSLVELKNLARQEGLKDIDSMSKSDLLDSLHELIDEANEGSASLSDDGISLHGGQRYVNALSDVPGHNDIKKMPGVSALPALYKETSIHLMLRDPQWAYVYWSVAPRTMNKLLELDTSFLAHFFLRVTCTPDNGVKSLIFEIDVDKNDTNWYINLPQLGCSYQVALCCKNDKGMMIALAQSMSVSVELPYWYGHLDELDRNPVLFNSLFSSIVTRSGKYKDSVVIEPLLKKLSQGDKE